MKKIILLQFSLLAFLFMACKKELQPGPTESMATTAKSNQSKNNSGHIKIAVLSDIHYMDPSLLQNNATAGTAFNSIFQTEPYKVLLAESPAILKKVVSELLVERPDIVLVAGDMAKDGERVSHEAVASYFNQLLANGIKVYVVPGNNDINNKTSEGYNGNESYPVPNVSQQEFKSIYRNFGFSTALASEPNSLSYVAEPFPGLRILAIDAERYIPEGSRRGAIKPETMAWARQQLQQAAEGNVMVLGLMHHNLIEHLAGQAGITPYTLVEDLSGSSNADNKDWQPRADSLISWGLEVMFSGHSHVTDISQRIFQGKTLHEIVTGSLVTPPSPYRVAVLKNKQLEISTDHVRSIDVNLSGGWSFVDSSNRFLARSLDAFFGSYLLRSPYSLSPEMAVYAAPLFRNAYMAHIAGDEKISPLEQKKIDELSLMKPVTSATIDALNAFWNDLGVKDNKWHIQLQNP